MAYMFEQYSNFGHLFKKFRLRSGLATLREFGDVLAEKGFTFEDSLFSHWQKNTRIPKDRNLLLAVLEIFLEKGGISSVKETNLFLESVGQGYLTEQETTLLTKRSPDLFAEISSPKKVLAFLISTAKSKKIVRTGWKREGIKDPESVAEHSFQLSIIAMILADQFGADREKLIKMAVVHDLGEAVTGDIVWSRGKVIDIEKRKNKEVAEIAGITKIFKTIDRLNEYRNIFQEMIENKSLEAKIFWQLDKLEMALQALEYEKVYHKRLDEFFINANLQIHTPFLRKIFRQILKQRPKIKI